MRAQNQLWESGRNIPITLDMEAEAMVFQPLVAPDTSTFSVKRDHVGTAVILAVKGSQIMVAVRSFEDVLVDVMGIPLGVVRVNKNTFGVFQGEVVLPMGSRLMLTDDENNPNSPRNFPWLAVEVDGCQFILATSESNHFITSVFGLVEVTHG